MERLLLFGGTTEGRLLARWLAERGADVTVCVTTKYAESLLENDCKGISVHIGKLEQEGMEALMDSLKNPLVVDATHPYAVQATENIRRAAASRGCTYLRLLREPSPLPDGVLLADSVPHAVALLEELEGAVLAATGLKELEDYTHLKDFSQRVYPRVLPTEQAVRRCAELGFAPKNIIAIQGPFSAELNCALMRQFHIRTLVTKDGGAFGGFAEKLEGAQMAGARTIVVRRPSEESGSSLEQIKALLTER